MSKQTHTHRLGRAASAACLLALTLAGCGDDRQGLVQVRSEKEANEILVALQGLPLRKTSQKSGRDTMWQISVPARDFDRAVAALVAKNLPRNEYGGFEKMIDSSGLIPTKTDERAKMLFARSQELEKTLELLDGVLNARVHIAIPEKDRYMSMSPVVSGGDDVPADHSASDSDAKSSSGPQPPAEEVATASVMLRVYKDAGVRDDDIKHLVANAVERLARDNVSVMKVEAELEAPTPVLSTPAAPSGPPLAQDERAEMEITISELKKNLLYAVAASVALALLLLFSLIKHFQRR